MKDSRGFTVIELFVVVAILFGASFLFFFERNNLQVVQEDSIKKTAINSMHHSLEEAYFKDQGHYPNSIDEAILPTVAPELFTDPNGIKINDAGSDYRYEPTNCVGGKCEGYKLKASLENEADYIKTNLKED